MVHSRSPGPVDAAVARGAARGEGATHLCSSCEVVITALPDSATVEEVVLGEDGVFSSPAERLLYIDTSTVSPGTAEDVTAARAASVFTPVTAVTEQLVTALRGIGRSALDHTAVLTLIEDLSRRGEDHNRA